MKLFLCGDVMTGRGIDQILPHPSDPALHEPFMKSAEGYVELAEQFCGRIPRGVEYGSIWGEALDVLAEENPEARVINLETAVTSSDRWVEKGINYRMNPKNIGVLRAPQIDVCALANNHVLDWGPEGLRETLEVVRRAGIRTAGAGLSLAEAASPAIVEGARGGRTLIFSLGSVTSGIPPDWAATRDRSGVYFLERLSEESVRELGRRVREHKRAGDVVIASIHWGANWGYAVSALEKSFAHALIDEAGVDLIHGHSSHHPKGIEIYRQKLILYGCGDFIDDYEGISGYEEFRGDLALMYFPEIDSGSGRLIGLELVPMKIRRFRLNRASDEERCWISEILNREAVRFETGARFALRGAKLAIQGL